MSTTSNISRRRFLRRGATVLGAAVAAPYVIAASALGKDGAVAPSERIVMGGIGIGNMGSGDQGAFLGRGDVQYVAVCDVQQERPRSGHATASNKHYDNTRLQGLQRLPRAAGPQGHRRGAHRHARPLARDHRDRGLPAAARTFTARSPRRGRSAKAR